MRKTTQIKNPTQQERILKLLKQHINNPVPLNKILALNISQYWARISELREKNYQIINSAGKSKKWKRCTFFTLINK